MSDEPEDELDDEGEMPWESSARNAIKGAAGEFEQDEIRGVIYMHSHTDHRFNPSRDGFTSAEKIRRRLITIGEDEWIANAPFDGGEAVFSPDVEGMVEDILARHGVEAFFERVAPPSEGEELATARDLTPPHAGKIIKLDMAEINDELICHLRKHPELMHELKPRKFEELVAELFKDKGYDVELTPFSKDGGVDIRAFRRDDVGTCLTFIECKRYAPKNRVSVEIVRGLYGVCTSESATNGIIATTSCFTRDAVSFQAKNKYKLHLADFDNLTIWLRQYKKRAS